MDPMEFLKPAARPREVQTETFVFAHAYEEFIRENPYIDIVSVVTFDNKLILTYKEAM